MSHPTFVIEDIRQAHLRLNQQIQELEQQRRRLTATKAALDQRLETLLDVQVGQIVADPRGQGQVTAVCGVGIFPRPQTDGSTLFVPYADVKIAPSTTKGYHATLRRDLRLWGEASLRYTRQALATDGYTPDGALARLA